MTTTVWTRMGCALLACGLAACAKKQPPLAPPVVQTSTTQGNGQIRTTDVVTVQARVVAINQKTRMVTLQGPEGHEVTFKASEDVRNLPQVHKGDIVNATYYRALALKLVKPGKGKPGVEAGEDFVRAEPGEKPAAAGAATIQVTATITNVDKAKQEVTLKGPKGREAIVTIDDPAVLDKLKRGDLVKATYTEAIAIAVDKPGA